MSLQSFITDIAVGPQNGVQEKKTLFREKSGYQYVVSAKMQKTTRKESVPNLINYNLSIRADDALLCVPSYRSIARGLLVSDALLFGCLCERAGESSILSPSILARTVTAP